MRIYIDNTSSANKIIPLTVETFDTIGNVKQMIEDKLGLPHNLQFLICARKTLQNYRSLADCEIGNNALVCLRIGNCMKISIRNLGPINMSLEVLRSETVHIVKQKILEKVSLTSIVEHLSYDGIPMDDDLSLAYYDVQDESNLFLPVYFNTGTNCRTTIFIRTSDKTIALNGVKLSDSIQDIKQLVFERTGIPTQFQKLVYSSKCLEDHRSLIDYNIQRDSTINLQMKSYGIISKKSSLGNNIYRG